MSFETLTYERDGRVARITLNRPHRGNGITLAMPRDVAAAVEQADLDPDVRVIALSGNGKGFCGGYDLVRSAERAEQAFGVGALPGSPLDPPTIAANHDPSRTWDPMVDYAMMRRNMRGFMSLFNADKPVVCKVHGFCVAGGTDMALCSDLLVIAADARIGYPPARVWGVPTTALWAHRIGPEKAKRLLFTGDLITGTEAHEWGLAIEAPPPDELDARFEALVERIARMPLNQLVMMKLLVNQALYSQGLHTTQALGTVLDGIARHTPEGYAFQARAMEAGFREAVRGRDEPFDGPAAGRAAAEAEAAGEPAAAAAAEAEAAGEPAAAAAAGTEAADLAAEAAPAQVPPARDADPPLPQPD
jgi:enoyl-CoA hydratase